MFGGMTVMIGLPFLFTSAPTASYRSSPSMETRKHITHHTPRPTYL